MSNICPYDPTLVPGCVSMHHCPLCGELVIAGMSHPDFSIFDTTNDKELTDWAQSPDGEGELINE